MSVPFEDKIRAKEARITRDMVLSKVSYCPTTGAMRWKSGRLAGGEKNGYLRINIFGSPIYVHRIAWLIVHGAWPVGVVDHINRDRMDNRAVNLRDVSPTENARNKGRRGRPAR